MGAWTSKVGFTDQQVSMARANLLSSANYSWELGVTTEALLELEQPQFCIFGNQSVPPPRYFDMTDTPTIVIDIAHRIVQNKPMASLALVEDDAVGDPPSIGNAVLLANWTRAMQMDNRYAAAAGNQLGFLLNMAPKTRDGAISHRINEVQLWADFIYMAPPFIAYFGALQFEEPYGSRALLHIAYDQIRLYRNYLRDPQTNLWRHIALGTWQDNTLWATGNAWVLNGILRVLETIRRSPSSVGHFRNETQELSNWATEIVAGAWKFQAENGTLFNSIPNAESFPDSAGTALMAAGTFRHAMITGDKTHVPHAVKALLFLKDRMSPDGWLLDVVDPLTFNTPGEKSPEAQAFVLLLQAAWRDYANWI